MLLLAPFVPKLVNYTRRRESLKNVWKSTNGCYRKIMMLISEFFQVFLKTHCAANNQPRCQKKHNDVIYKLLLEFAQKYFSIHERLAVKNLFGTYVCYNLDGLFWLNVYRARLERSAIVRLSIQITIFFTRSRLRSQSTIAILSKDRSTITIAKTNDL